MDFELVGSISEIESIAVSASIRDIGRLRKLYGAGRWRKMKGCGFIRVVSGRIRLAEIHWYEAHGVGRREFKIKQYLDG